MDALVPLIVGYAVGSLPLGYLIAIRTKRIDLRAVGSGNVGAANVHRTAGLKLALLVVCVDVAKGVGSVLIAARVAPGAIGPIAAGVGAIVGHAYPIWLRFRGGKGVATACGVFWILAPLATSIAAVVFLATVWATRYVSLGSLVATVALPPLAWMTSAPATVIVGAILAALFILERHRGNLGRLFKGTERRLGQRA